MSANRVKRWYVPSWPLLLLCVLSGSRWLLEGAHPEMQSTGRTQAVGCLLAAGFVAFPSLWRGVRSSVQPRKPALERALFWRASGGALALAGPALGAAVSDRFVHADDATLALALTPCVVAVAMQAVETDFSENFAGRLWPGLAGVAGLLLLLPQPSVQYWRLDLALGIMPIMVGVGAVHFAPTYAAKAEVHGLRAKETSTALVLAAALTAAIGALELHQNGPVPFSMGAAALDGIGSMLALVSLQRLRATRWAALFLLAPLCTLLEGAALLSPMLDWRSWLAFCMLAAGGGYLLLSGLDHQGGSQTDRAF